MSTKEENKDHNKIYENRQDINQSYHAYIAQQQTLQPEQIPYPTSGGEHHQNSYFYNWAPYYYPYYHSNNSTAHPMYINQDNPYAQLYYNGNNNINETKTKRRRFKLRLRKHKIGALHFLNSDGAQPLFVNILHIVSAAILIIAFPIPLLSIGYVGPSAIAFACGPMAAIFSFWAVYFTPCECYPNIEWAVKRTRVFATVAAILDSVGVFAPPLALYGAQCPDHNDSMFTCEDEIAAVKAIAIVSSSALVIHLLLCLLVRSNAYRLVESKFELLDSPYNNILMSPMNANDPVSEHNLKEELMPRN